MRVYLDPRMLGLFLLGFSSGLPRLLVYSTLTFWLIDVGLTIESVGLFAATATPYNLKFLWAPLLDRIPVPGLARWLGMRRAWILVTQGGLIGTIAMLALSNPAHDPVWTAICAIAVAAFSASQDVVIDAYRVEILEDEEQGAGAAVAVFGYRAAMLVGSAGALYLTDALEKSSTSDPWAWTYGVMAAFMLVGVVTTLMVRRPETEPELDGNSGADIANYLVDGVVGPFKDFMTREGWYVLLLFVVLFKIGDALAGTMTNPFLIKLGFDKTQIADIAKTYGLVASIVGVFVGGWVVRSLGIVAALWVSGFIQLASNFMFSFQAYVGADTSVLIATIGIENLTGGIGTAAFVAFLSSLCNKRYTATQYALLTALSSVLTTFVAAGAGFAVAEMGWVLYFAATAVAALPGVLMIYFVAKYLD